MKTSIKVLAIALAILFIGLLIFSLILDGIVKSYIEDAGSDMLQTQVKVEDVSLSLLDSKGYIDGIIIENPEGFSDSAAVKLQAITIKLDLMSMLADTMIVDSLIIKEPSVHMEQKLGGNNLKTLQENIGQGSTEKSGGLVIDYLLVEEGTITISTDIGGQRSAEAELSRFEQENIGRAGSNTVESSIRQILEPLLQRAMREAVKGGLRDEVEDKVKKLLEG